MARLLRQRYHGRVSMIESQTRCPWCLAGDTCVAYHDRGWGVPVHDERMLFELPIPEGAR